MYKVIVPFKDLKDGGHVYRMGDVYPHAGVEPSKSRIAELSTASNLRGVPLIRIEEDVSETREGTSLVQEDRNPTETSPTIQKPRKGQGKAKGEA